MNGEPRPIDELSLDSEERIDEVCARFEAALKTAHPLSIEDCVDGVQDSERSHLLGELLILEIAVRAERDEDVDPREYLRRFPAGKEAIARALGKVPTAICIDTAVRRIKDVGIVDASNLDAVLHAEGKPQTTAELFAALKQKKLLTDFQECHIRRNKAGALVINDYVLVDHIGKGGMGHVFLANDRKLGRKVALKIAADGLSVHLAQRFQREIRTSAKLEHANLVRVYDAVEAGKRQYLVMEYLQGKELGALLRKSKVLSPRLAVDYVIQVARGLAFAHKRGIIHRDVKPGNILVDQSGVAKVLDLGLAKARDLSPVEGELQLTQTRMVFGTPDYLAPEQADNPKNADERSDIYSLGCTLFHLLTGRVPYPADSLSRSLRAHQCDPIPSIRDLCPQLPSCLDAIVSRMMAKKPSDRFARMDDVVGALEEIQAEVSEVETPSRARTIVLGGWRMPRVPNSLSQYLPRSRRAVMVTIGLCLLGVVAVVRASFWQEPDTLSELRDHMTVLPRSDRPQIDTSRIVHFTAADPKWRPLPSALARPIEAVRRLTLKETDGYDVKIEDLASPYDREQSYAVNQSIRRGTADAAAFARKLNDTANAIERGDSEIQNLPGIRYAMSYRDGEEFLRHIFQNVRSSHGGHLLDDYRNSLRIWGQQLENASRRYTPSDNRGGAQGQIVEWLRSTAAKYEVPLPTLFRVDGVLDGVRTSVDHTWVFLWSWQDDRDATGGPAMETPQLMIPVRFASSEMATWMADYSSGDLVRAIVALETEEQLQKPAPHDRFGAGRPSSRDPYGYSNSPYSQLKFNHGQFGSPVYPSVLVRGVLIGHGIQKIKQPESWIDPELGRAQELANPEEYQSWLGCLYRDVRRFEGVTGILRARYQSVKVHNGRVMVDVSVPKSAEGTIDVRLDMGQETQAEEFADYRNGEDIVATVIIREALFERGIAQPGVLALPQPGSHRFSDAPQIRDLVDRNANWSGMLVDCTRINRAVAPDSLISASGPRRQDVTTMGLGPADAGANRRGTAGTKVQWTGTLRKLVERQDECHLLVQGANELPGTFEAYTRSADFIRQLNEYVSHDESHDSADSIVVSGALTLDEPAYRISKNIALVELDAVWKTDNPEFKAVPGRPDDEATRQAESEVTTLAMVWRSPPPVGQNVRVQALVDYFAEGSKVLRLKNTTSSSLVAEATLSISNDIQVAKELQRNQLVWVTVRLAEPIDSKLIVDAVDLELVPGRLP